MGAVNVLEKEFGTLNSDEVILRNERLEHIRERHPEVADVLKNNYNELIKKPNYILKDSKNENTALFIKNIEGKNYNTVIKMNTDKDTKLENSTITFYKIRDRELKRLLQKSKILLTEL